jgi:micrococcal nuclease
VKRRTNFRISKRLDLVLLILLILAAFFFLRSMQDNYFPPNDPDTLMAVEIRDGDTFTASNGEIVRLLGIDTPEKGEPFYDEATRYLYQSAYKKELKFETDFRGRDRYGRLLAYVFNDESFINLEIVKAGLANVYIFPKDMKNLEYRNQLIDAQRYARENYLGIWSIEPDIVKEQYIGNKNTFRFHRPSCRSAKQLKEKNRVVFSTQNDFFDIGFSPCRNCKP